jgi:hypothetical protein
MSQKIISAQIGAKQKGEDILRRIPATKIARLKMAVDGARKRIKGCKAMLNENCNYIRRKSKINRDARGETTYIPLSSDDVAGLRLKQLKIEEALETAKGDYRAAQKEYRAAVAHNTKLARKTIKYIRVENRTRRESGKLLKQTKALIEKIRNSGGTDTVTTLTGFAVAGDTRGFRETFDKAVEGFDPALYTTISGVSNVKTEIIHDLMDEFQEAVPQKESENEQHGLLNGGAQ